MTVLGNSFNFIIYEFIQLVIITQATRYIQENELYSLIMINLILIKSVLTYIEQLH